MIPTDTLVHVITNSSLSDSTKKQYTSALLALSKCIGHPLYDIILSPKTFNKKITELPSCAVQACTIKAIIAVFKYGELGTTHTTIMQEWRNVLKPYLDGAKEKWDNNIPAARTEEGSMTWKQIIDRYNIISREKPFSLDHVTLAMYTIIPPRRQMDYWKVGIISNVDMKKDAGWTGCLDLSSNPAKLTISQYKTKSTYDVWEKVLPKALDNIIRNHLTQYPNKRFLFETTQGQPYGNRRSFAEANNNVLKRVLKNEKASVNIIRHAAATYVHKNQKMSIVDKRQYAYDMGHNYDTQGHYMLENNQP